MEQQAQEQSKSQNIEYSKALKAQKKYANEIMDKMTANLTPRTI